MRSLLLVGVLAALTLSTPVRAQSMADAFVAKEVACLTEVVYFEAGEESQDGKLAVATVVMNRVGHRQFPPTVCGVVYQRNRRGCQFSWVCGKKWARHPKLYERARAVAEKVYHESARLQSIGNALYFHNVDVRPSWADTFKRTGKIGRHIFYVPRARTT